MSLQDSSLVSGKRLAGNVVWNLLGLGLPTLIAIVTIPLLIDAMGESRFGVLTLAWMTVGYFGLFDMGLGRAMTQLIARQLGGNDRGSIPALFWTGMVMMLLLGVAGALTLALAAPWLVRSVLRIPAELQSETLWAMYLISVGLPMVISSSGLQGVIEAHQRFRMVFILRMVQGAVTFLGPLIAIQFTMHLGAAIGVLLMGRLASWLVSLIFCFRTVEQLGKRIQFQAAIVKTMSTYGGWLTISNILAPLLAYADRFLIGAVLSARAVAYYTTPSEIVVRLLMLPNALLGVIFPIFAGTFASDPDRVARLFDRSTRYLYLVITTAAIVGIGFAHPLIALWLGQEFAEKSYRVMQWLMVGILFNGVAHIPSGLIVAVGRPDLTAKLHTVEAPLYLLLLWFLVRAFGIEGAAVAWTLRAIVDAALLVFTSGHLIRRINEGVAKTMTVGGITAGALVLLIVVETAQTVRVGASLLFLLLFGLFGWYVILKPDEQRNILAHLQPWRRKAVAASK